MMVTHRKSSTLALTLAAACLVLAVSPSPAAMPGASVGLFLTDPVGDGCNNVRKFGCEADPPPKLAGDLNTPYYVYLAVFNGDPELGVAGLSCGIDYSSVNTTVYEWQFCANGLQYPGGNWPSPGGGNVMTFQSQSGCQVDEPEGNGVTAIFGYFYVTAYGNDRMKVTANEVLDDPGLFVAECAPYPEETELDADKRGGYVGFSDDGSEQGLLPCVEKAAATWGQIKTRYGQE